MFVQSQIVRSHPLLKGLLHGDGGAVNCSCPCCGTTAQHNRSRWFYRYQRCRSCRSIFLFPRPCETDYTKRLETVVDDNVQPTYEKVDLSLIQAFIDRILYVAQFHASGMDGIGAMRFLDYGCGFGRMLLAARSTGFSAVHGYDPSKAMVHMAKGTISGPTILVTHEIEDISDGYDIVFCEDVIEHSLAPLQILRVLFDRLHPGGLLFISTPVISGMTGTLLGQAWWCAGPSDHYQLYSARALSTAIEQTGFEIADQFTDTLITWFAAPPRSVFEKGMNRLWYRLNRIVVGKHGLRGDNFIIVARRGE